MSLKVYSVDTDVAEIVWTDSRHTRCKPDDVYRVSVDGVELKRALAITGLPQYGASMKFYGDMAKHIVGNWFNEGFTLNTGTPMTTIINPYVG